MILQCAIIFLSICALTLVISYLLSRKIKDTSKYLKAVPGPKPVFPFGNMLDFTSATSRLLEVIQGYVDKHGETILVHESCFRWAIITVDYDFIRMILSSSTLIEKASRYDQLNSWLGKNLFTSSGDDWRARRKLLTPSFHFTVLQEFIRVFNDVGDTLVEKLRKEVGKNSVEISELISFFALDAICEATMGTKMHTMDGGKGSFYIKCSKELHRVLFDRQFSVWHPKLYPMTFNHYKEKKLIKYIHEFVNDIIKRKIEERKQPNNTNNYTRAKKHLAFLDHLLEARIDGRPFTMKELQDEVNTFMFAGHDTITAALSFCIYMLATQPEVQEKVFLEQCEIFQSDIRDAVPTYKQLSEMTYLTMVIKETLRLYPPGVFFGRSLTEDLEFEGILFPKGMNIMIFPFILHRNPKYFPNPAKFLPERFEDNNKIPPFAYIPFSGGPRNCIGQKVAMLEMLSTISKLVRHFELGSATPEHKIELVMQMFISSKNGIKISIQNRKY